MGKTREFLTDKLEAAGFPGFCLTSLTKSVRCCFTALGLGLSGNGLAYDCSDLAEYAPGPIATGEIVENVQKAYQCKVGGWCQQGGPYEPGVGWAWQEAWQTLGECEIDTNQRPVVEFNLPSYVANGTDLNVTGTVFDPDGLVQQRRIYINGELKSEHQALYGIFDIEYAWRPALGTHTMTIEVEDDRGAVTSVSDIIVVTPNAIPNVNILTPGNKVNAGAPFEIKVEASDPDGFITSYDISVYDYTLDGAQNRRQLLAGESNQQSTIVDLTVAGDILPVGEYILIASFNDNKGATERDSLIFDVGQLSSRPVFNATIPATARVGNAVTFSFTALPFASTEYGIASITVNGEELNVHQGWQSLPNSPNQWAYSGAADWSPVTPGFFDVVISLDHPNFPTPITGVVYVDDTNTTPTPTVTPTPTITVHPTPTPTPTHSPTPLPTPVISISAPDFVEIDQIANFTVTVDEFNETGVLEFFVDGEYLYPSSVTWEDAPNPNSFVAKFSFSSGLVGIYPVEAKIETNSGVTVTAQTELEVIYQCYTGGVELWNETTVYFSGDKVIYNNRVYEARFWSRGDNPETTNPQWGQWKLLGPTSCY